MRAEPTCKRLVTFTRNLEKFPHPIHHVRIQQKHNCQKQAFTRHQICGCLDLDFPASRNVRNKCYLNNPIYGIFVTGAQED